MAQVPVSGGLLATVDDADLAVVAPYSWCRHQRKGSKTIYARAVVEGSKTLMHRLLLPDTKEVDHRNGNGLDNRRENLRPATRSQNQANIGLLSSNTSGFKGVTWDAERGRWKALIVVHGKRIKLGRFLNKEDAARVYAAASVKYFSEFARTK